MENEKVTVIYNSSMDTIKSYVKDIEWETVNTLHLYYYDNIPMNNLRWLKYNKLQKLHIEFTNLYTLDGLNNCPNLVDLSISYNKLTSINSANGLEYCTALEILDISNNIISSLDGLQNCTTLLFLNINNNTLTSIDSLNGLQNCTALKELHIQHNKLISLKGLENCTALEMLYISDNTLHSLDGLQNCTALKVLYIYHNKLISLKGLENCISLKELSTSYNNITSLDGLQNCTSLQTLYISDNNISSIHELENCTDLEYISIDNNTDITILPNFLIEFINLREFKYDGLALELDARQMRWLNRLQNIQHNTYNIQVYGNSQNVHDSSIQESVRSSMSKLLNQSNIATFNPDTLTDNIVLDTVLTSKSKDQLLYYISTTSSQEELVELSLTYGELLWTVWQTIHRLGGFDETTQQQIKQILNQELEDSDCKCFTGRMTRLVNCLNGFSPLVEIKILDGVQIGNIVAIIKQRLETNQYEVKDVYKGGYTVEKHKEEFRKEMLDRGENMKLIDEWIEYIE